MLYCPVHVQHTLRLNERFEVYEFTLNERL